MAKKKPNRLSDDLAKINAEYSKNKDRTPCKPPTKPLVVAIPAFPRPITDKDPCGQRGMDLRDYFAAAALVGLLQSDAHGLADDFAVDAYSHADAMLLARGNKQ